MSFVDNSKMSMQQSHHKGKDPWFAMPVSINKHNLKYAELKTMVVSVLSTICFFQVRIHFRFKIPAYP